MEVVVLHIITGLNTGGAERSLVKLIETSNNSRFEHVVISLTDKGTQRESLETLGIPVYEIGLGNKVRLVSSVKRLRKLVREINPDVIHGWMYHGSLVCLFSGSGAPKIMGIRHSLHNLRHERLTTQWVIRFLALRSRKYDRIVYNSSLSKTQHQEKGYHAKNSMVIPNGFNTTSFKPDCTARKKLCQVLSIQENILLIGHVARFHPMKNQAGLIRAFQSLASSQHRKTMLLMAGLGLKWENQRLVEWINEAGLAERVLLLGERPDISHVMSVMDIFVLTSSWGEAFPNVLGEAMSCGIPCIATDVGDSAAIIGDTGIVVPPNDTEALSNAMLKMAQMPREERETLGKRARQRIIDKFRLEIVTKQYEELYLRLLKTHSQ